MSIKNLSSLALFASVLAIVACGAGGDHDPSVVSGGDGTDATYGNDASDFQGYGPEFGDDVNGTRCEGTETVRSGEFEVPLCAKSTPEPDPIPEAPVAEPPADAPPAEAPPADVPAPEAPAPEAPPAEEPPAEEPPVDTQLPEQPAPEPTPEEPPAEEPPVCQNPDGDCSCDNDPTAEPPIAPDVCRDGKTPVCHLPGGDWEKRITICVDEHAADGSPGGADHIGKHGEVAAPCVY